MNSEMWEAAERAYLRSDAQKALLACEMCGLLKGLIDNGDCPAYLRSTVDELLARFERAQREASDAAAVMRAACEAAA
jgi:hypothetical protein